MRNKAKFRDNKKLLIFICFTAIAQLLEAQTPIITNPIPEPFDVSNFIFTEQTSVHAQESAPSGLKFNSDGSKLFIVGQDNASVIEYHLGTNYDFTTAVYAGPDQEYSVVDQELKPIDIEFNLDGTKMFILGFNNDAVVEYELSIAFDVSTATYSGRSEELSLTPHDLNPRGMVFNPDGTKLFIAGNDSKMIFEFDLNIAFDVSTAQYTGDSESYSVSSEILSLNGLKFNNDGTKLLILGSGKDMIFEYTLEVPYDVSTAQYAGFNESLFVINQESIPFDLEFNSNGTKLFITGANNDMVVEYELTLSIDYIENGTDPIANIEAHNGQGGPIDTSVSYSLEGEDRSLFNINADGVITFISPPNFEDPQDANADNIYVFKVVVSNGINETFQFIKLSVKDIVVEAPVFTYVGTGFDITNGIYAGIPNEYFVGSEESIPQGIVFSKDGFKMFVLGSSSPAVHEYNLTIPFQAKSATYAGPEESLDVLGQESFPRGMSFNSDGTKMFIVGAVDDAVVEYALSNAYDISTADYSGISEEFSVRNEDSDPNDVTFNSDGSKMYIVGGFNKTIFEYHLAIPFDISTATQLGEEGKFYVGSEINGPTDLKFNMDGSQMIISGRNEIEAYNLLIPYSISTSYYAGNNFTLDTWPYETSLSGMSFNQDGTKLFVIGTNGDAVIEYLLPSILTYAENSSDDVIDIDASDVFGGINDVNVTYTLEGEDASLFSIDESGIITFLIAIDFENPQDADLDNTYDIEVIADNSIDVAKQQMLINVLNVAPVFSSESGISIPENTSDIIYTALADESSTFSLGSSKDESQFILNSNTLSFLSAPDFEHPADSDENNIYLVDIIAIDGSGSSTTLEVAITVTNLDEIPPVITSPSTISIPENFAGNFYSATANESVVFSLGSSEDSDLFILDGDAINFIDAPDFENPMDGDEDNTYVFELIATDLAGNTSSLEVGITITDVDDAPPVITSASSLNVEENTENIVYIATANEAVTFSLGSSKDERLFILDGDALSFFNDPPDFENPKDTDADNIYLLELIATDLAGNSSSVEVEITVTDLDEIPPVITSPSIISVPENFTGDFYTATADESVVFSLRSSEDSDLFILDGDAISFINIPDFENPLDGDVNNTYTFELGATDVAGNSSSLVVEITVTDVDDSSPIITSASSVNIEENTTGKVYSITANEAVTFSLGSDKDESLFALDGAAISFIDAPNFESPTDANSDNIYQIDISAVDVAGNSSTFEITITVTDVDDQVLSIVKQVDLSFYPNPTYGRLTLEGKDSIESVTIIDFSGRMVARFQIGSNKESVDVSSLQAGTYVIVIRTEGKAYESRFIKK